MGNLLGDFVKGRPWDDRFSETIWRGIMEHRRIDVYTDSHPVWRESRGLLPLPFRRYSGIIIDIFYDHFLIRNWHRFSPEAELGAFIDSIHRDLDASMHHAPVPAAEIIRAMMTEEWLEAYASLEGIKSTLVRVSMRSLALVPVASAFDAVYPVLPEMEEHFLSYYPDLIGYVEEMRPALARSREFG
jgi:acyl carrier protein phosphodiesterase